MSTEKGRDTMRRVHLDIPAPAPKGRNLNSLALERQVARSPTLPTALKGRRREWPAAYLALKRQAIQISPFQG